MNCHAFYKSLIAVGLSSKQANRLVNGAKRRDLGDYEGAMLGISQERGKRAYNPRNMPLGNSQSD